MNILIWLLASLAFAAPSNPVLAPWPGKNGGLPPFGKIKVENFEPALDAAMEECRKEFHKVVDDPAVPTFANTIAPLEKNCQTLDRVQGVYYAYISSVSSPQLQEVVKRTAPKSAAFADELGQNPVYFKKVEAIQRASDGLNPEQKRALKLRYDGLVHQGAKLNDEQKKKIAEINQKLAALTTQFEQNQLADESEMALVIDAKKDLAGLPTPLIEAAAADADRHHLKGKWRFANTRSAIEPFLTYANDRALREKAFRMWTSRGDNGNAHDNNKLVPQILQLRTERAKLLGFDSYAAWRLSDHMVNEPKKALDLMLQIWKPAVAKFRAEVADQQKIVDANKGDFKIQPWDVRYYAEKVRKAQYDFDGESIKPYLQVEKLRDAMFFAAGKLYGYTFEKTSGIPVYAADMSVYKVLQNGKPVGLWYFDPYARPGAKNSGAWMHSLTERWTLDGREVPVLVSNTSNFIPAKPGQKTFVSWDDASTMFHEFGHALHYLSVNVTYPTLNGVVADFGEFPSQFNEYFLPTPEVLKFLTNEKGETLPPEMLKKLDAARNFNQGFATTELLASGILDMKLHAMSDPKIDTKSYEQTALKELGMPSEIVMRHRLPAFAHIFGSPNGYAAGYYVYVWSEVMARDAFAAFLEKGSPWDPDLARSFFTNILAMGNKVDGNEAFRLFRGRDPKVEPLLKARGLVK